MSQLLEKLKINKNPERKKEFKVGISKPKEAETNKPVEIKRSSNPCNTYNDMDPSYNKIKPIK